MSQHNRNKGRRRNRRGPAKNRQPDRSNGHPQPGPAETGTASAAPAATPAAATPTSRSRPSGNRGTTRRDKEKAPSRTRQRWFYDVRQYAILTDAQGQVLLLQLPADYDTGTANTWTLPGGKLEPADEPLSGICREITEETALVAEAGGIQPLPVAVARWSSRNSKKLAIFYRVRLPDSAPKPTLSHEHQRAIWAKPDELKNFPFHRPEMLDTLLSVLQRPAG